MAPFLYRHKVFSRRFAYLFLILISLPLICNCSRTEEPTENIKKVVLKKSAKLKVLIIGIDGMAPALTNKYLNSSTMPNLKSLIDNGTKTTIYTRIKLDSPIIWTTMATSAVPEVHGITDFTINNIPANSTFRKVPAIWNILESNNIKTATLGWWATWPAEKNAGIMISDRAYWGDFKDKIFPEGIIDTDKQYNLVEYLPNLSFLPRFTSYPYNTDFKKEYSKEEWDYRLNKLIYDRLIKIYYRDQIFTDIAIELLEKEKPQVLNLYLRGVDYVSHAFWQFMEPGPFRNAGWDVNEKEVSLLKNIIPEYYAYTDELIGRLLPYVDKDTTVFIISDHGFYAGTHFKKDHPELDISGDHDPETLFILSGSKIKKNQPQNKEVHHTDFLPTVLHTLGLPLAENFEGRPLKEFFTTKFNSDNPSKFIKTYQGKTFDEKKVNSNKDGAILKNLKSLGYIK